MERRLSFNALRLMDGARVKVVDKAYDAPTQKCQVQIHYGMYTNPKNFKTTMFVEKILLQNEEFVYELNYKGECVNGEFEVYSI